MPPKALRTIPAIETQLLNLDALEEDENSDLEPSNKDIENTPLTPEEEEEVLWVGSVENVLQVAKFMDKAQAILAAADKKAALNKQPRTYTKNSAQTKRQHKQNCIKLSNSSMSQFLTEFFCERETGEQQQHCE